MEKTRWSGQRPSWDEYFLELAEMVAKRSTCVRRHVGAVLVKEERIIATGYNGAPQGLTHCLDAGCLREEKGIPSGYRYELCRGVHAEQNAVINAARYGVSTLDSVLYCTNQPCVLCARMLINAGVKKIVHRGDFQDDLAVQFLREAGVELLEIPRGSEEVHGG
ncbi:MAG: cytidine deaminase [Syntrophomonadaceae bacterium]|nr:cytidine deaminase [Syntrophomonadaceae bacterium]